MELRRLGFGPLRHGSPGTRLSVLVRHDCLLVAPGPASLVCVSREVTLVFL